MYVYLGNLCTCRGEMGVWGAQGSETIGVQITNLKLSLICLRRFCFVIRCFAFEFCSGTYQFICHLVESKQDSSVTATESESFPLSDSNLVTETSAVRILSFLLTNPVNFFIT